MEKYNTTARRAAQKEEVSAAHLDKDDNDTKVQRTVQEVAVVRQWLVSLGFEQHTKATLRIQEALRPGHVVRARKRLTCYRERRVKQAKEELKIAREHLNDKLQNVRTVPRAVSLRCNVMDSDDIWVKFDQEKSNLKKSTLFEDESGFCKTDLHAGARKIDEPANARCLRR